MKESTNIKHDKINAMNIINNIFNLHNSFINHDNKLL